MSQREINFITEVKFEDDQKSIPFKCWSENNKVYVKLNIEKGGSLSADCGSTMSIEMQIFMKKLFHSYYRNKVHS